MKNLTEFQLLLLNWGLTNGFKVHLPTSTAIILEKSSLTILMHPKLLILMSNKHKIVFKHEIASFDLALLEYHKGDLMFNFSTIFSAKKENMDVCKDIFEKHLISIY